MTSRAVFAGWVAAGEGRGALITRSGPTGGLKPAQRGLQVPRWSLGGFALSGHKGGFGRDTRPIAGRCVAGDTGATGGAPCHYCKAGSDRAGARHLARLGHHVSHGSGSDKGRTYKGLARFARTLPALTPSHLCNNPRAIAAPLNRKGEPNMHFHPTRPMAHQPKPPPTCTAPRARHGGVHRDTQERNAR